MTFREKCSAFYYTMLGDKTAQKNSFNYSRELIIATGMLILGFIGFYGYRTYRTYQEQAAQKVLSECIHEYEKAIIDSSLLPNAELVFKVGYETHKSSKLAPYFLAYRADIVHKQDKKEEAFTLMNELLSIMPQSAILYTSYAIKRALMRMELADETQRKTGLEELQTIANNTNNDQRDEALYYIGLYHWSKDELAQAKLAWTDLIQLKKGDRAEQSPWAVVVQEKLAQIV